MLETIFDPIYNSGETLRVGVFLILTASALILGAVLALCYRRSGACSRSFALALATLPAVVSTVILLVSGSIGAGVAVAGTFSLVRFRSAPGSAREIAAVFTAMALGLACGMGCPALAALFTLILCAVSLLYARLGFGEDEGSLERVLNITVPESLEYSEMFDDLFAEYTSSAKLTRVRTTNLGSLNRLSYEIRLRRAGTEKAFIDELRCRNGNLEISLTRQSTETAEL